MKKFYNFGARYVNILASLYSLVDKIECYIVENLEDGVS